MVRATGRKDRHSKVCTARGPRDRRVRLAAHTAIEFYDVQDRLGYDRPSKAVDWLIKKAKPAIDELSKASSSSPSSSSWRAFYTGESSSTSYRHPVENSSSEFLHPRVESDPMKACFELPTFPPHVYGRRNLGEEMGYGEAVEERLLGRSGCWGELGSGVATGPDFSSWFQIPARIKGEEEGNVRDEEKGIGEASSSHASRH